MKSLKKILSLMLTLALFFAHQSFTFAVGEETFNIEESDICNKLIAFGIFGTDELTGVFYDEYLSRGDFIKYAVRLGKIEYGASEDTENPFSDVEADADCYEAILAAYSTGIISGEGNSRINPDAPISMKEAAKILLNILGYGDIIALDGGYPDGYMKWANNLKLFSDCSFIEADFISPRNFVQIMFNSLEAPCLNADSVSYTGNDVMFRLQNDGETLLNHVHDIYELNGIADSNEYTSLYGKSTVDREQVSINDTMYYKGNTSASELLGRYVRAYYKMDEENDRRTLLYIETAENKNDIKVVKSEDILCEDVTVNNFSYLDENSKRKLEAKLSNTVVFIYNGHQEVISENLLCPEFGDVTLIDNDKDGLIDVVLVMNYRIVRVSGISSEAYLVSDELGGENLVLNPEDNSYDVIITRNGKKASFEDIALSDIISYAQSLDGSFEKTVKQLIISSESVEGKIEAISDEFISVNETDYKVSSDFRKNIRLNEEGVFFIDHTGRIVDKDAGRDFVFGYLNRFEKSGAFDNKVIVQIFTENNRWVELELNDYVKVNDYDKMKPQEFYNAYWNSDPNTYRQLITYNVNPEGRIISLNFAQEVTLGSEEENTAIENATFRLSKKKGTARYRVGMKSFDNDVLIADKTKIFLIPEQTDSDAEKSDFRIVNPSYFVYDQDYYNISAYNMDEFRLAEACVLEDERNFRTIYSNESSKLMIVTGHYGFSNKNGDEGEGVKGVYNDTEIWLPIKSTISKSEYPQKGDIIRFGIDPDGYAINLSKLYESKNGDSQKFLGNDYGLYSALTRIAGEITDAEFGRARLKLDYGAMQDAVFYWNTATLPRVYIYNKQNNEVTLGSVNDLIKGSFAYVSVHNFRIYEAVIFE